MIGGKNWRTLNSFNSIEYPYPYSIPSIESCLLLFLRVVFPRCLGVLVCSRSARIRSSNTAAGSSLGSWGTSSPRKALASIDRSSILKSAWADKYCSLIFSMILLLLYRLKYLLFGYQLNLMK